MNFLYNRRVPVSRKKHHSYELGHTVFRLLHEDNKPRKTGMLALSSQKPVFLRSTGVQGKLGARALVCRFHEFLRVGPKGTIQKSKFDDDVPKIKELLSYGLSMRKMAKVLGYTNHISLSIYIKKRRERILNSNA